MIKAILFDFVGVLLFKKKNLNEILAKDYALFNMGKDIGSVIDDTKFKKDIMRTYNLDENQFQKNLKILANQFESLIPLWNLLPSLHDRYNMAIVNNGTTLTLPLFKKKYPIDSYFDFFICSGSLGIKKPDKQILIHTTELLNISPQDCLFMDDHLENITSADRLGMKTILWENKYSGFKKFKQILKLL
jgi:HAD superfamily hydrolase (TIGR01509 family)